MASLSARPHRSAVIAGAGIGLGRDLALSLAAHGYIVFGTAASADEAAELRASSKGRVSLIVCNKRKNAPVVTWADGVSDAVGEGGIDLVIVVTAAGFDAHVFVTAFMPALRKARGRVMVIGSPAQSATPLQRNDLKRSGIEVVAIPQEGAFGAATATMTRIMAEVAMRPSRPSAPLAAVH